MIHVFHGFLGTPEDFKFLQKDDVILHDLYQGNFNPTISPEDILIGYSMGGRLALELASKINFNLKQVILINAHPGLATEEERDLRKIWEDSVITRLETMSREEFFLYWNELPIFENDRPLTPISEERYKKSACLFDQMRLSKQDNFLPQIERCLDKVMWIIGLQDSKYQELAENVLLPLDIHVKGIKGGHRLFQQPDLVKELLISEGIL